jgi:hypothetical protein
MFRHIRRMGAADQPHDLRLTPNSYDIYRKHYEQSRYLACNN